MTLPNDLESFALRSPPASGKRRAAGSQARSIRTRANRRRESAKYPCPQIQIGWPKALKAGRLGVGITNRRQVIRERIDQTYITCLGSLGTGTPQLIAVREIDRSRKPDLTKLTTSLRR